MTRGPGSPATDLAAYLERREHQDLLRFMTCGSVDDGKSSLIGRLLHDTNVVYDDHLAALRRDSVRYGTTGAAPDLALLLDGLQAERDQGITIDVAYRHFSTERRSFLIADAPGHEQYTRNMATAASVASLAIILIDAVNGVLPQTKRHATIVTVLGIRHVVLAINKMDLAQWSESRYRSIVSDFQGLLQKLEASDVHLHSLPISALHGDNVVRASDSAPWYRGPSLLELLETVHVSRDRNLSDLRFPVQNAIRRHAGFRGYAGTVASGVVRVGEEVMVLPSRRSSRVKSIVTYGGEACAVASGRVATITLEDELDVTRGDMIVHPDSAPEVSDSFDAILIWMDDTALRPGQLFDLKLGTAVTQATVQDITWRRNMCTLDTEPAAELALNDIGQCSLALSPPVPFDRFDHLPATGRFIIIDRMTNMTVGAGMVQGSSRTSAPSRATNVTRQETKVSKSVRAALKNQRPTLVWFTGLSGAGKSTIANAVEQKLVALGHHTYLLDGDNVRLGLNRDLGFEAEERVENIRRVGEVGKLLVDAGLIVLAAFISPFRSDRQMVREMFEAGEFIEVFVDTPLAVAEARDPKGLYGKARMGLITNFTGIDSPYERPQRAELRLATVGRAIEEMAEEVVRRVLGHR